jgi:beta-glucanase (GH16 family)
VLTAFGTGVAQEAVPVYDFADGVPVGQDPAGNPVGFPIWQDGSSTIELSVVEVEPGSDLTLPDQEGAVSVLSVRHGINAWGGFTHAYTNADASAWQPLDLSAYDGIRFWYKGDGRGGTVQFDLFDNRNPDLPGDTAERYAYRFVDDTTDWRAIEVPFGDLFRRTDFQPGGAPDDGLTLSETWGWALGFPPGEGTSYLHGIEAYGASGDAADDAVTVQFASPVFRLPESGEVDIALELSAPSDEPVSVRVFVQADTATAMRDLVTRSELVIFPPGVTEASFTVRAIDDGKHEGEERGRIVLSDQRGADLGFLRNAILVIDDDDDPVPGMIADFEAGIGPVASDGATLSVEEILSTLPTARPDQERFENVLVADGGDAPFTLTADLAYRQDWSDGEALSFWYHGRGDGADVTVTILDDVAYGSAAAVWETVFADEFDAPAGTSPNWDVWTPEIGDGTANGIPGWGNAELQAYTDRTENVAHDGEGNLVISARESGGDAPACYYGGPCAYTSARLITKDTVEFTYGRVEARVKLPFGQGLWPAFWLLGADIDDVPWPASGEIDIMENVGFEPSTVHGTIHGPGYSGGDAIGRSFTLPDGERFADDFHLFGLEWEPGALRWYVDGELYSTVTPDDLPRGTEWVYDHSFFLLFNIAVGGNWPGAPDDATTFPQTMAIDYVRVLQPADVAERFAATFQDDVAGWRRVDLLFGAFVRADEQPQGAPNDGLGLRHVSGLAIDVAAGAPVRVDEVRVVGD